MTSKTDLAVRPGAVALMALMAATRFRHFGTPFALPDASLAVFFLAGLWLGGKWCRQFAELNVASAARQFAALVVSTSVAFLFSNGSFYWLSGRYTDTNWAQYIERFAKYYPPYLTTAALYVVVIFAAVSAIKAILAHKASQQHA